MYCTKCGAKISDEATFCTKCGQKVKEKNNKEQKANKVQVAEIEIEQKTELIQEPKTEQPTPMLNKDIFNEEMFMENIFDSIEDKGQNQTEEKPKKFMLILVGILGFIAVAVIVVLFCILFMNRKEKGDDVNENTESISEEIIAEEEQAAFDEEKKQELINEGSQLLLSGDADGALEKYEEAKELDSKYESAYLLGSDIYLKQGNYNMALEILEEGFLETQSTALEARREYVCKNIVISEIKEEGGNTRFSYTYDSFGNLIKEDKFNEWYEFTGWNEIEYNNAGNKVRCSMYNADGTLAMSSSYGYDTNGHLVSQTDYDEDGESVGQHRYLYDSEGHQIECNDYNEKGKNIWNTKSEYDSFGRKIKDAGYNEKDKLMGWVETMYNTNGEICKMARYDKEGVVEEWNETSYNTDGNPTKFMVYGEDSELIYWTETEYNENGIKEKTVRYNPDGSVFSYSEYDLIEKKVKETNEALQATYSYVYQYIGDILCESNITPVTGKLTVLQMTDYRRKGNSEAAFVGTADKGAEYFVIGETDEFYQVEQGWYFAKNQQGIQFTETD